MNGPCGGSQNGKCEVSQETPCVWNQIYDQLDTQQLLATMETIVPPKDWTTGMENHPRKMILEHLVMKNNKNHPICIEGKFMLTEYIQKAMELAHYEIIEDEGTYWGEISNFQGVWGRAINLEKCREELREALEEWIIFRLKNNLELPVVEGINLNIVEHVP